MIVNTYYQLLTCLQLKNTIFRNDNTILCVTDHSNGMERVFKILSDKKTFSEAIFVKTKQIDFSNDKFYRIVDTFKISFDIKNRYTKLIDEIKEKEIDEILFYNTGYLFVDAVLSYFGKFNKKISVSLFEEGILSYNFEFDFFKSRKIINKIRRIRNRRTLKELSNRFYCFYPNIYFGTLEAIGVPLISSSSIIVQELREIFTPDLSVYDKKFIFFTSVYDFEGGRPVGEYNLVCKIASIVGKDNLLVKIHPRDTRTIYQDNGFNVDKNSVIPWEVIQLSGDFSDKVFLTINSTSVLSGSTMSEKPVITYYMYKLCDISGNESCKKNARDIESILNNPEMKETLRNVKIAERLEDVL